MVDDDEDDFILTRDILNDSPNKNAYSLTWCSNYEEGINAMLKSHYDLYLVDYNLGKHTGIDLLHEAIRSNCAEPIIMLTGQGDLIIDEEAMKIGAADYLVKGSITSQTLERSIRYSLGHSRALSDLKASEYKFRMIFERSKDPMIISDASGTHYDANAAALNYFELSRPDFLKSNASEFYPSKEELNKFIDAIEAKGSVTDLELQLALPNGKTKYCSVSAFLQISQHGTAELFYSILHDLTNRKQQEQKSVFSEKLAVSERIAKNLADEIKNPLSNVNFALEEMSEALKGSTKPVQMFMDVVKENCNRINQLTTDFIASTEPKNLVFEPANINAFLQALITDAQKEYQVSISYSPLAGAFSINADTEKLNSALRNIIKNSSEALPDTNRNIGLSADVEDGKINIRITDNGNGIDEENLDKIFEPFYSTKPSASGLGLTYTQQVINAHGGSVSINSSKKSGTVVTVMLPLIAS